MINDRSNNRGPTPSYGLGSLPDPGSVRGGYIPIVQPAPGQTIRLWVVCSDFYGRWTHWTGKQTRPCSHDDSCEYCAALLSRRWRCYLGCWCSQVKRLCIAEMTERALESVQATLFHRPDLRGWKLAMYRDPSKKNGVVTASLESRPLATPQLPPPFDLASCLERIWGVSLPPISRGLPRRQGGMDTAEADRSETNGLDQ